MLSVAEYGRLLRWWALYHGKRRDITLPTWNGTISFSSKDWLVGKYLYVKRGHETQEIRRAMTLLQTQGYLEAGGEGSVVNLGAHIGLTCIALLRQGYFRRAVAYEPSPESFRLLLANIRQNNLQDRISAFPLAISSAPGETELELSGSNSGDNRIRRLQSPGFFGEERRSVIKVPVETLDRMLEREPSLNRDKIRLLWLDAQGHEGCVLEGARRLLGRGIPVVTEFWPYGIGRSGMAQDAFHAIAASLFTHFYVIHQPSPAPRPIDDLNALFKEYSAPRQVCLLALVNEGSRLQRLESEGGAEKETK